MPHRVWLRALVLTLVLAAAVPTLTTAPARARTRAEARVGSFLTAYRRAVLGQGGNPRSVRAAYLTADLNRRLDAWARTHRLDPVFRTRTVPVRWSTRYEGSGAGHSFVIVTERLRGGGKREVWYQVRLSSLVISDLEDPPS
ncbi:hypothetical protein ACIHFE_20805 [Streptomyces sp. NPDC052396]|uniref:hypothetical protein n=1 Tax=Streptomyces sp. NPDC052396 TaxID=3365689 RepID=UPI0037CEA566